MLVQLTTPALNPEAFRNVTRTKSPSARVGCQSSRYQLHVTLGHVNVPSIDGTRENNVVSAKRPRSIKWQILNLARELFPLDYLRPSLPFLLRVYLFVAELRYVLP